MPPCLFKRKSRGLCQGCAKRIDLPLARPPAFAMPPAKKRPFGRSSHHAFAWCSACMILQGRGFGELPNKQERDKLSPDSTKGWRAKGYPFPLLAKLLCKSTISVYELRNVLKSPLRYLIKNREKRLPLFCQRILYMRRYLIELNTGNQTILF